MGTAYLHIEYTCNCGQCETVKLFNDRHDVRLSGPIQQEWTTKPRPYRYDPSCANCARRKREDLRIISTDGPEPSPPEREVAQRFVQNRIEDPAHPPH